MTPSSAHQHPPSKLKVTSTDVTFNQESVDYFVGTPYVRLPGYLLKKTLNAIMITLSQVSNAKVLSEIHLRSAKT
jgi:hypothetical protein